jgi:RNA polymerase sigma-70 factor (ECF subfamily)
MEKVTAAETDDYARLVRSAADGDPAAMDQLLRRAQGVARRFSLAVCGDESDAEDAVQEALLKTYRSARQIRDASAFRPWLYRVVRNACLVSRRKRAHEPSQLESLDAPVGDHDRAQPTMPADPGHNPEQLAEARRQRARLRAALAAIPRAYRVVLFLRDMEGLSTREAARVLGISHDSVKTRLHRARAALHTQLTTTLPTRVTTRRPPSRRRERKLHSDRPA